MRLSELEPEFLQIVTEKSFQRHDYFARADGIIFLCPVCFRTNGGPVGTHSVICWQPHVPQSMPPVPGRWSFQGTGYEDLTLVAGSSSILLTCTCKPEEQPCTCCKAHFYVRGGNIEGA